MNNEWIKFSDAQPTKDEPVWYLKDGEVLFLPRPINVIGSRAYTHWQPAVVPDPPNDDRKVGDQVALNDFIKNNGFATESEYWHAALKWERARVMKNKPIC